MIKNRINQKENLKFTKLAVASFFLLLAVMCAAKTVSAAEKTEIRYNGKLYTNTSKKLPVRYNEKTVSKASYKAIKIDGCYMVPYTDVFKNGVKAVCSKNGKKLTMKANGTTLKMTVGKKSATLDGKKVELPTAPLSVYYVSKKKTKILVPVKYVAKNLGFTFYKNDSYIQIKSPLNIKLDGVEMLYRDVQGKIYYNHAEYATTSLPVMKLNGKFYIPAKEVVEDILGLEYVYSDEGKSFKIVNEDLETSISGTVGSNQITVNNKKKTMNAPALSVQNIVTGENVLCVPAASLLKNAGYTRKWNKKSNYYEIQSSQFFVWQKELSEEQKNNTAKNYLYKAEASYSVTNSLGSICFRLTGSSDSIMNTLTIKREKNIITVTMPSTSYLLDKNSFTNFGEIIKKAEVSSGTDGSVTFSLTCLETTDYSYTIQDGVLELRVLYTYANDDGHITDYSLFIQKPSGITAADVTNEDMYPKSKAFKVIIKGDYVDYFKANPIVINDNTVKSLSVKKSGKNTVIKAKTTKLRGYKIYVKNNSIVVSMGAPKDIYGSIVVLDAGHGGFDPGAQNKNTNEKDLNFKIIYTLMKPYFSDNAPDIKVYWTRTTDSFVTLADRAAFAKKTGADAFISLHMNSASSSTANGTEVYYSVSNNNKDFSGITSKKMAALFKDQLIGDLSTKNRGTKSAAYYVLKHNTVPSILIELGFISGSSDYGKLTKASFQKKAAKSIYTAICTMFKKYPAQR